MIKGLDVKLANIHADPGSATDFILADAKDADMGFGVASPGPSRESGSGFRSLAEYRDLMREVARQGLVDILLMSASSNEILSLEERLFDFSTVTPATRANDATDIYMVRGGRYSQLPSLPFRSTTIEQIQYGKLPRSVEERKKGCDLALYSVTFNNDSECDRQTLEGYGRFRLEAEEKGLRHFLEVFDPNVPGAVDPDILGGFINDHIVRMLAGVTRSNRPLLLKMPYHGPKFMEELAAYDPHLVPGILGGSSGTTYDAFKLLSEAKKHGARAALFGRKINGSEHQLTFVEFLRRIADDDITPEEAVAAYHGSLQRLGIKPLRTLQEDRQLTVAL